MASKIVLTGASGKIGGAVLAAILNYNLTSPSNVVIATSSKNDTSTLSQAADAGVEIRQSNYESVDTMTEAFAGCQRLFLVSTPHIDLDFDDCAKGGRETHHFNALEAAKRAGVSHIYYTSLAFQDPSKAAVMRAHLKTEDFLKRQSDFDYTILREGIYSESWPLYLGHFKVPNDGRNSIIIGPDGPISWTSIQDLGLANALIITGNSREWAGKSLWLSAKISLKLSEVAAIVERVRQKSLSVKEVSQQEYVEYYVKEAGMNKGLIEWWSSTYSALSDGECYIQESPFEELLAAQRRRPRSMEQIIEDMLTETIGRK